MPTINSLEGICSKILKFNHNNVGVFSIIHILVMCGKDHMDVHLSFSAPFDGIVSSKGM